MKTKLRLASLIVATILMVANVSHANNLQIGTPTQPASNQIQFTISWSNAWNNSSGAPNNWDAAWVFVKQQDCTNGTPPPWTQVTLTNNPSLNSVSGGSGNLQVDTASDGMGVFIRVTNASSPYFGNASGTVTLTFASTPANTDNYKVFGIEMVYVPQVSYYLGDGTASTSNYYSFNPTSNPISSEGALTATQLGFSSSPAFYGVNASGLSATYPKGYASFYCMKYEVTQHQYADFLNTLTYNQQTNYCAQVTSAAGTWALGSPGYYGYSRNGVKIITSGVSPSTPATYGCDLGGTTATAVPDGVFNEAFDGQDIACNWLSYTDLLGYLCWSGLRPMTDLEYEKACRGPANSVNGEYAWGTTHFIAAQSYSGTTNNSQNGIGELGSSCNTSNANEAVVTGSSTYGLCADSIYLDISPYFGIPTVLIPNSTSSGLLNCGPMRVGFAATSTTTTRASAGATYWGILDMTGNVWERTVGTVSTADYNFNGWIQGNGTAPFPSGSPAIAWPTNWPVNVSTTPYDCDVRGGAWTSCSAAPTSNPTYSAYALPVSGRYFAYNTNYQSITAPILSGSAAYLFNRTQDAGGRGVRSHQ